MNRSAWTAKFERNIVRDVSVAAALENTGWRVIVVWECETRSEAMVESKLVHWFALSTPRGAAEALDNRAALLEKTAEGGSATTL